MAFVVMLVVWALTRSFVMSTAGSIEVRLLLPAIIPRIRPGPPIDWAAEAHKLWPRLMRVSGRLASAFSRTRVRQRGPTRLFHPYTKLENNSKPRTVSGSYSSNEIAIRFPVQSHSLLGHAWACEFSADSLSWRIKCDAKRSIRPSACLQEIGLLPADTDDRL
jgi:hypothetical protein